ncbi:MULTISPECIES: hypothetical protein [unclassified Sedimentibacter]|uniref:hypothetical protein n=1 Tax=unclassified Sedimentibacter TaxID=2649220 RepID=UPI0027E0300A|nr:hypothetical protein [Sedimentibacter sp. MB35-C1]WMJ78278.1 hypothetical protein RBQ61_04930 [Sedimentibacter sp. MB35-C1]
MNGLVALLVVFVAFAVGDFVSYKTKATFSMLFTTAIIFLVAFWLGLPATVFSDSGLLTVGILTMSLLLVNMGTLISLNELAKQWKTVLIAISAVVGIGVFVYMVGGIVFGKQMAAAAAPPISGGVVAALIVSEVAKAKALESVAVFATLLLVTQTFFGTPVASYCLKKEARIVLDNHSVNAESEKKEDSIEEGKKKLIPELKKELRTNSLLLAKLALVAFLATKVSELTNGTINALIVCLIFGVIASEIGFLEKDPMTMANSQGFVMIALLTVIFNNLSSATPQMLMSLIGPILGCLLLGVIGFSIFAGVVGKILGMDIYMSIAIGASALFGFPGTFIIPNEVASVVGKNEEEKNIILEEILPKMIIAGFVTVSIASVGLAGVMSKLI